MSRACPCCRTNGADLDDPQGLCGDCAYELAADECADEHAAAHEADLREYGVEL